MRTAGEILQERRKAKHLSLTEVEKATKIRERYLEAIEKNDFGKIPGAAPIVKGFIKNYAEVLELSADQILAVFRRDFSESKTGEIVPHGYWEPIGRSPLSWNPRLTVFFGIFLLFTAFAFYFFFQVFSLLGSPKMEVFLPKEGEVRQEMTIEVAGKTDPDATVTINGELVILDKEGKFKTRLSLFQGENTVQVEAVSRRHKKTTILRHVTYTPED